MKEIDRFKKGIDLWSGSSWEVLLYMKRIRYYLRNILFKIWDLYRSPDKSCILDFVFLITQMGDSYALKCASLFKQSKASEK